METGVRAVLLVAGLLAGSIQSAAAQQVPVSRGSCFARPAHDACASWWPFEMGGYLPLAASSETLRLDDVSIESPAFGPHVSWDFGYMRRIGATSAIGAVGMAGFSEAGERLGIKGRYERSLPGEHALDLSAGWLHAMAGGGSFSERVGRGVTADLRVSRGDWLSAGLRYDWVSTDASPDPDDPTAGFFPTAQALYGGVTLRQRAGVFASAGFVTIFGGYALLYWIAGPDE